ncbi:MAG TPA: M20 family peptidase [Steroidobacteraceae bacterium]|nr:M20 family peptidase [Steroidobacteraceae bacterium]
MIRRAAYAAALVLALLAAALAVGTWRHGSRQLAVPAAPRVGLDEAAAAERLAGAVRFRTVSYETPSEESRAEFLRLHAYLARSFPHAHAALTRELVGGYSLLYTWPGREPAAKPILLMAHQDVVPVAPGTEGSWHAAPFAGEIRDGFVWGRGTWDDKGNLLAILEAVEMLAAAGFQPRRTLYLAFGHDEENGGLEGARAIAALLGSRGVRLGFVTDEGMLITDGMLPGLASPAALIGVAEKGSVTLSLTAVEAPGHSSMPGPRSAIGALAAALARLERAPLPASLSGVPAEMLATLAPEMSLPQRVALSNLWLFGPLVRAQLERTPATDAMLRTTTALTVVRGGNKDNVLPGEAVAHVNFRLLPGERIEQVVRHVRRAIHDERLRIEVVAGATEASPVAASDSASYRLLNRTIRELFPGVVVAPGLMIGGTDSRHMTAIADAVYRFSPVRARSADLARFHGTDERISIANYAELIRFYERLIRNAAADGPSGP